MLERAIELLKNAAPGLHLCQPVRNSDEPSKSWWKQREMLMTEFARHVGDSNE